MEFFLAIFFLLFYYIRPQDWMPGLEGANLIKPIVGIWLIILLANRSKPSPLPGIARTPHDWMMLLYLGYIIVIGDGSISATLAVFAFYALTVQSVNTWPRLLTYLKYWNGALIAVAAIAVASKFGLDLTGAQELYFTQLGRLAIGTWIHNNPNALAHSVVVAIPLSLVLYFWKGTFLKRFVLFPALSGLAFYCAWETQSKGAYLVAGALIIVSLITGRPKFVQILAISAAMIIGVSALSFLPRMNEMNNLRSDSGVQGRLLAWEMARTQVRNDPTGLGWKQFVAYIPWQQGRFFMIVKKATHSSYVQIAADLGIYGLFLYLCIFWAVIRTLISLKPKDEVQERCRRALVVLTGATILSGWMINRQYHTEFFLLIGAAAAMHRLKKAEELEPLQTKEKSTETTVSVPTTSPIEKWRDKLVPAFKQQLDSPSSKIFWNRFGIFDVLCGVALTRLTLWTWDYLLKSI